MFGRVSPDDAPAASHKGEGDFDVVLGNPPYVRIQTLKQQDPKLVEFYKEHYDSAGKGNYNLYVVFVEAGLRFLKCDGQLAYILPHKFFNAQYGEPLRKLIAAGRHLRHVVYFGDQPVFPGATNYVCLLFLARAGADACRFVRSDDLAEWLRTLKGTEGHFSAAGVGASEWNFSVGVSAPIMQNLAAQPRKLADVAARIFQGLVTGADPVFIMENRGAGMFASGATEQQHEIEASLMHPLCKGAVDIRRYFVESLSKLILFPYEIISGEAVLIPSLRFRDKYPKAWKYLLKNRDRLEAREGGKWKHERWYALGRSQNLSEMEQKKILTPSIAAAASYTLDDGEFYYFVGSGGGYGITLRPDAGLSLKVLLALLNSTIADFFLKRVTTPFANGYFAYNRQFIEQTPIAVVPIERQPQVERLVDCLLWLNRHFAEQPKAKTARDALMLGWWEQVLNGLVYELYFPDELHAKGLRLFDQVAQAQLPDVATIPDTQRLPRLRTLFKTLHSAPLEQNAHPFRIALDKLQTLDTVRIIEGKV